jgi:hypothetical protein
MDNIGTKNDCWRIKTYSIMHKGLLKHCILPSNLIKHGIINFNFHITTEAHIFQGCTYHIDQ